jgi:RNA polymerase sigma factor (sigma-70 family)
LALPHGIKENMEDTLLLREIRKQNNAAFEILYQFYFPVVERFVLRNNGTRDDAKDVFQETIMALMDNVPKEDFKLTSSLKTYIFAIASNIWLKRLRLASRILHDAVPETGEATMTEMEQEEEEQIRFSMLERILWSVTRHCKRFLSKIFFTAAEREQLMKEMGYSNTHSFDNQKYKCLEQTRKIVKHRG